ncbi:hypothetical protein HLI01_08655 [Rhizobium laguerreae]|uniref:hypothetical protein n=1 Tax=Rhizobium laguerreae TaxID=1076926 RepID=UPI0014781EED|nr:hypothetical protein [Rhizobium laguerreae]NNH56877.1 hypothetical protein [Rhizobium laguerreae]
MTSMVERVARVLAGKHWDENPAYRDHYKTLARAAIEEIKGCAEEFGKFCYARHDDAWWIDEFCENALGDYLDAALKEEPKQ